MTKPTIRGKGKTFPQWRNGVTGTFQYTMAEWRDWYLSEYLSDSTVPLQALVLDELTNLCVLEVD